MSEYIPTSVLILRLPACIDASTSPNTTLSLPSPVLPSGYARFPLEDPLDGHVSRPGPIALSHFLNSSPSSTTESVNRAKYLATGHFALHGHTFRLYYDLIARPTASLLFLV